LASRHLKAKFYGLGLWTYGLDLGLEVPGVALALEVPGVGLGLEVSGLGLESCSDIFGITLMITN